MNIYTSLRIRFALLLGYSTILHANVTLPLIFGDHVVLQQSIKLLVLGKG